MSKQTALKWFLQELETEMQLGNNFNKSEQRIFDEIKQEALKMEREQMEKAISNAISKADMIDNRGYFNFHKWYNKTYGGQDE
jgi:hypothetical protein